MIKQWCCVPPFWSDIALWLFVYLYILALKNFLGMNFSRQINTEKCFGHTIFIKRNFCIWSLFLGHMSVHFVNPLLPVAFKSPALHSCRPTLQNLINYNVKSIVNWSRREIYCNVCNWTSANTQFCFLKSLNCCHLKYTEHT